MNLEDMAIKSDAIIGQGMAALAGSDHPDCTALVVEIRFCVKLGLISQEEADLLSHQARRVAKHRRDELREQRNRELVRRLVPPHYKADQVGLPDSLPADDPRRQCKVADCWACAGTGITKVQDWAKSICRENDQIPF